eukprot:TRINITY_DN43373_c0_g1_i1.p1 TRINITY_DN43373_c0_g1~~TRINITY_DN43373_c0_g1_i1.p1  ORF type:complete len:236 (-),score=43.02 TRINITY_DN43373_c0_g1_i1:303-971(-)
MAAAAAAASGWRRGSQLSSKSQNGARHSPGTMPVRRIARANEADVLRSRRKRELDIAEKLMAIYDTDLSGLLDLEELRSLLADYTQTIFETAQRPTMDDMEFLMLVCGRDDSAEIGKDEVMKAVHTWDDIVQQGPKVKSLIAKYDKDFDGQIGASELQALVTEVNEGIPVADEELRWFMDIGDTSGDGQLDPEELTRAVAAWMGNVAVPEDKNPASSFCVVS